MKFHIERGEQVIITDPIHKKFFGKKMFCLCVNKYGFILLSFNRDAAIADLYLGFRQCEKVEQ